jgi:hypothetical protein
MKKTTIIGVSVPAQVQALLSAMDSIEFFAVDSLPNENVFEFKCPDFFEEPEPEFVIPPKRLVPHYRELEVSKKKGKRRNY